MTRNWNKEQARRLSCFDECRLAGVSSCAGSGSIDGAGAGAGASTGTGTGSVNW